MRRTYTVYLKKIIMGAVLGIFLLSNLPYSIYGKNKENNEVSKKVILIDPGHGGYDGGADGKTGIKEKDINLSICLKLRDKLTAEGFKVVMTREKDEALLGIDGKKYGTKKAEDLANRCRIKRETNTDIFISIHQNYFPQGQYYGSQVWYSQFKESRILAHITQENLRIDLDKNNKRVEKPAGDNYKMLRNHDTMPSILVESGFLSNYNEEMKLKEEKYQDAIANSLVKSINMFFKLQ